MNKSSLTMAIEDVRQTERAKISAQQSMLHITIMCVANTISVSVMSHRQQWWRSQSNYLKVDFDLVRESHSASLRALWPWAIEDGWKLAFRNDRVPRQRFAARGAAINSERWVRFVFASPPRIHARFGYSTDFDLVREPHRASLSCALCGREHYKMAEDWGLVTTAFRASGLELHLLATTLIATYFEVDVFSVGWDIYSGPTI